jgi:hypothetical protein
MTRLRALSAAPCAAFVLALSGCGDTNAERGLSGAAIGAGVGAAGAGVTGNSVGGGALLGGAVGAATGVLTDRDDIDLGDFPGR